LYASRRNGIWLEGDGKSSIRELITRKNTSRSANKENIAPFISIDLDMKSTLEVQELTLNAVIDADQRILIKSLSKLMTDTEEIRTIYDENVTHLIGSQLREEGARATRAIRSEFLGVDIITRDMTVSLADGGGIIGEVNTTPGMHHHTNLKNSEKTPSAVHRVLRYLLEKN
jgi:cyanophycin synthetase